MFVNAAATLIFLGGNIRLEFSVASVVFRTQLKHLTLLESLITPIQHRAL